MKTKNRAIERNKKRPILVGLFIVIVLIGVCIYIIYTQFYNGSSVGTSKDASSDQFASDRKQAEILQSNPNNKKQAPNTDPAPSPSPTETNKQAVQMYASVDKTAGTVNVRGGVNYPVVDGKCFALLTGPANQVIRKDTTLLQNPASTDCKTIQIPVGELGAGKWSAVLKYSSDKYEGSSNEVSFTL